MYRMVCRGPPAGQDRLSYVEFKREAAGNDSDISPSRASATRDCQGRPRGRKPKTPGQRQRRPGALTAREPLGVLTQC